MADPLRRRVRARAWSVLAAATRGLPPAVARGLLGAAGSLALRGRPGAVARANLRAALGGEIGADELERLRRAVFRHAARLAQEWSNLARAAPPEDPSRRGEFIDRLVELDPSVALLEQELARGRGAIVVTAHIGNWELLAARLRRLGLAGAVVGRRRPDDPSARWFEELRRAYGVETLSQGDPPRRLLEVLRSGGTLGMLCDLEVRRLDGEFLDFFGRPALFMKAPASLARVHGVPLIPVRCTTIDARRYRLSVERPLALRPAPTRAGTTRELLGRLVAVYERWIREAPAEWAWHQPRWRTRPGEYRVVPLQERRRRGMREGA